MRSRSQFIAAEVNLWLLLDERLKVLLFAYEFPPVLAAQALRWYYLGNELASRGVQLDVLTPSIRVLWGHAPVFADSVLIHRCFPGPFVGLSGWLATRLRGAQALGTSLVSSPHLVPPSIPERIYRTLRGMLDQILIPDLRTEWLPFAWRTAQRLHAARHYDLVISSHEPGVDILLGLRAQKAWRIPLIVDLADPLIAPYTPQWRVRWDRALESRACHSADGVLVTAEAVGALLADRHDIPISRFTLIRQGFDPRPRDEANLPVPPWPTNRMVLLFTGNFYRGFREPSPLLEALEILDGVCAVFVGGVGHYADDLIRLGDRVMVLGRLPHHVCLAWQRRADVLVNIGNRQDYQVPGKIFEYLGAARPILHIATSPTDPVPVLLEKLDRGLSVGAEAPAIADAIRKLQASWQAGRLDQCFDLTLDSVQEYSWKAGAARLHELMGRLLAAPSPKSTWR